MQGTALGSRSMAMWYCQLGGRVDTRHLPWNDPDKLVGFVAGRWAGKRRRTPESTCSREHVAVTVGGERLGAGAGNKENALVDPDDYINSSIEGLWSFAGGHRISDILRQPLDKHLSECLTSQA